MNNPKLVLLINVLGLVLVLAVAAFMISEQRAVTLSFSQTSLSDVTKSINSVKNLDEMKAITIKICKTQILLGSTYLNRIRSNVILLVVVSFLFLVNLAVYYGNKKKECCPPPKEAKK